MEHQHFNGNTQYMNRYILSCIIALTACISAVAKPQKADIQLSNINRLFDLFMEDSVDQHSPKAVYRQPRAKELASIRPNAIIKIRPDYLVYPSAYSEKNK